MELELELGNFTTTPNPLAWDYFGPNYAAEIPLFLIILSSMMSNVLTIYTIVKYKLCATQHYMLYILNWKVCDILFLASCPSTFHMFQFVLSRHMCFLYQQIFIFILGNLIFVTLVTIDWYISTYRPSAKFTLTCRKLTTFISVISYVAIVAFTVLSAFSCVHNVNYPLATFLMIYGTIGVFILIVVVHVLRCIKLKTSSVVIVKNYVSLVLATSFFLCWFPHWFLTVVSVVFSIDYVMFIEYVTIGIVYVNGTVDLVLLYWFHRQFRRSFWHLCQCDSKDLELRERSNVAAIENNALIGE